MCALEQGWPGGAALVSVRRLVLMLKAGAEPSESTRRAVNTASVCREPGVRSR